jgi:hypothetical protein
VKEAVTELTQLPQVLIDDIFHKSSTGSAIFSSIFSFVVSSLHVLPGFPV